MDSDSFHKVLDSNADSSTDLQYFSTSETPVSNAQLNIMNRLDRLEESTSQDKLVVKPANSNAFIANHHTRA